MAPARPATAPARPESRGTGSLSQSGIFYCCWILTKGVRNSPFVSPRRHRSDARGTAAQSLEPPRPPPLRSAALPGGGQGQGTLQKQAQTQQHSVVIFRTEQVERWSYLLAGASAQAAAIAARPTPPAQNLLCLREGTRWAQLRSLPQNQLTTFRSRSRSLFSWHDFTPCIPSSLSPAPSGTELESPRGSPQAPLLLAASQGSPEEGKSRKR